MSTATRATGTGTVKSADRALDILELLAASGRSLGHAELARRTGIPKSSLTMMLRNLVDRGYVAVDPVEGPTGYRLGDSTYALARQGARVRDIVAVAQPALERLTRRVDESSALYLLRDDMAERVCSARSERALLYAMHVGVRAPLYANSAGKLFLAWKSARERERYLAALDMAPLTDRTLRSPVQLRRQLPRIRQEQAAYSLGEFTPGVAGVSVPVLDPHGKLLAGVGVALPEARLDEPCRQRLLAALRACAAEISAALELRRG
ncbi:IclR family transcriptional regulator [Verticiella sediminum]|uniref:IclR family transcriptional regulator n=1 Tax=Verticiella sediminum TaxID=1247510 RepID=UPI0014788A9F|nr:IclR family transcriptional regulator [Verticiella sediminum]